MGNHDPHTCQNAVHGVSELRKPKRNAWQYHLRCLSISSLAEFARQVATEEDLFTESGRNACCECGYKMHSARRECVGNWIAHSRRYEEPNLDPTG